jgi:hypothetical protein
MTSEVLAAARLSPIREDIHDSRGHEDGEIRSEDKSDGGENLADVDADPNKLVAAKSTKSYLQLSFLVNQRLPHIFPVGDVRAPSDEQVPTPEANEVVVFRDFFTCGLRFPCDPILPSTLGKFFVKIHQLSPNSFLKLLKFFWIMKTFRCTFGADIFTRLFELVIEKDVLKLDDGQYYEAHYACCTFNTRLQNSRKGLT